MKNRIAGARSYADHLSAEKRRPRTGRPITGADHPDDEGRPTRAPSSACAPWTPDARNAAVEDTAGAMTGTYGLDELEALREDWPS